MNGRQTAVAVLRARWDALVDDHDADWDRTDEWLCALDPAELRAAIAFLVTAVIAASESTAENFPRDEFLRRLGLTAATEVAIH